MIRGTITNKREATVRMRYRGPDGLELELDALVDTGFSEYVTLPPIYIAELNLVWRDMAPIRLADGSLTDVDVYEGRVYWNDEWRDVLFQASDSTPLIGMALLYENFVSIVVIENGEVTIEPMDE